MADSEQTRQLREANQELVFLVTEELDSIFYSLNLNRPEQVRDSMIELLPLLVDKYGPLAAAASADWYQQMMPGSRPERIVAPANREQIASKVRWAAGDLFTDNPFATLQKLTSALGVWTRQPGRDTIQINANRDKVGWARQPTGATTCAFCLTLASRSAAWLYNSRETALHGKDGSKYHGDCDCQPILVQGVEDLPDNFDHQGAYVAYTQAREATGSANPSIDEITAALRRMYPDILTDGVHELTH